MVISTRAVLAQRIVDAVTVKNISELELSERTDIPRTTLRRKLRGRGDFTIPELQVLSVELDEHLEDWIRDLTGDAA